MEGMIQRNAGYWTALKTFNIKFLNLIYVLYFLNIYAFKLKAKGCHPIRKCLIM